MLTRRHLITCTAAGLASSCASCAAAAGSLHVEDFREGGWDDRRTIQAALLAWSRTGGVLRFDGWRDYDLGEITPPGAFLQVTGARNGVIEGGGCTLSCRTAAQGQTQVFLMRDCHGVEIRNFTVIDHGADIGVNWRGAHVVYLDGGGGPQDAIRLSQLRVISACSLLTVGGSSRLGRVSGIQLTDCSAQDVYYGIALQENGDDLIADLQLRNCRRAYFPYGVTKQRVRLAIFHDGRAPSADACIMIGRYSRDTTDLDVNASFSGYLPWSALVRLEHKTPLVPGAAIANARIAITVNPDARIATPPVPVALSAASPKGRLPVTSETWRDISITANLGPLQVPPVVFQAAPERPATVSFTDGVSRATRVFRSR